MEITGQVWDELQAQNTRLHQLLREKDDENLKLMTERVKSNQLYNLSKEENETMMQHVSNHRCNCLKTYPLTNGLVNENYRVIISLNYPPIS